MKKNREGLDGDSRDKGTGGKKQELWSEAVSSLALSEEPR